jgi:hypothetical protein
LAARATNGSDYCGFYELLLFDALNTTDSNAQIMNTYRDCSANCRYGKLLSTLSLPYITGETSSFRNDITENNDIKSGIIQPLRTIIKTNFIRLLS